MTDRFANPLLTAEQRAEHAEGAAAFWRFLCGCMCACVMALGVLLGIVGHEHQSTVEQRVQQSLALPKN